MTAPTFTPGQILTAAEMTALAAALAPLDPATGQLALASVPGAVTSAIAAAQATATGASTEAQAAAAAAQAATTAAQAAQATATAAQQAAASAGGGGGGSAGARAQPFSPPHVADFTLGWLGQSAHAVGIVGGSTATDDAQNGLRFLFAPCDEDENQVRGLLTPAPAAPYECVAHVRMPSPYLVPYSGFGIGWMVQATRSCDTVVHGFSYNGSTDVVAFARQAWTVTGPGDSTCTGTSGAPAPYLQANPVRDCWFRLVDDGTNRFFYVGTESDQGPWHLLYSCPRAQDIGVPDAVGVFASVEQTGTTPPGIGLPLIVDFWSIRAVSSPPVY